MANLTHEELEQITANIQGIFDAHHLTDEERNLIWEGMASLCWWHLRHKNGPFYEAVKEFVITAD